MGILTGIALAAALMPRAHGAAVDAPRFAVDGTVLERTGSGGTSRYTVTGNWTVAAPHARYALKATLESDGATCGTTADVLLADGFE